MTCREKILSENYLDIIDNGISEDILAMEIRDYCIQKLTNQISNLYVNRDEISRIFPEAEQYSILPKCYGLVSENNFGRPGLTAFNSVPLSESGIFSVQGAPLNLTGIGVLVAVIDTGIDYENPLFRKEDGSTRIRAIWDQTNQNGNPPPGFLYGTEYTKAMIDEALGKERPLDIVDTGDELGHGTSLAAVMCGKGENYYSPAPEAEMIVVKLKEAKSYLRQLYLIPENVPCYQENDIMAGIAYARNFVEVTRQPVVVCLGLGSSLGNHAGNTALSIMLSELSNLRNFSVVSCAGDEGNRGHHYAGEIVRGGSDIQEVEINVSENHPGFFMEFWGREPSVFQLAVRSPAGESTGIISNKNGQGTIFNYVYGDSILQVDYVLAEDLSGWQAVYLRFIRPTFGIWTIQVIPQSQGIDMAYHMWLPLQSFLPAPVSFLRASPYETLTSPIPPRNSLVISGYNNAENAFYIDSSRGYTTDNRIRPDLCAPAVGLSTPYGIVNGTDFAAALVTGAVAQMYQWGVTDQKDIYLDDREIRNYLLRGATKQRGITYPNPNTGYGLLNLVTTFEQIASI